MKPALNILIGAGVLTLLAWIHFPSLNYPREGDSMRGQCYTGAYERVLYLNDEEPAGLVDAWTALDEVSHLPRDNYDDCISIKNALRLICSNFIRETNIDNDAPDVRLWTSKTILETIGLPSDFWIVTPVRDRTGSSYGWQGVHNVITNLVMLTKQAYPSNSVACTVSGYGTNAWAGWGAVSYPGLWPQGAVDSSYWYSGDPYLYAGTKFGTKSSYGLTNRFVSWSDACGGDIWTPEDVRLGWPHAVSITSKVWTVSVTDYQHYPIEPGDTAYSYKVNGESSAWETGAWRTNSSIYIAPIEATVALWDPLLESPDQPWTHQNKQSAWCYFHLGHDWQMWQKDVVIHGYDTDGITTWYYHGSYASTTVVSYAQYLGPKDSRQRIAAKIRADWTTPSGYTNEVAFAVLTRKPPLPTNDPYDDWHADIPIPPFGYHDLFDFANDLGILNLQMDAWNTLGRWSNVNSVLYTNFYNTSIPFKTDFEITQKGYSVGDARVLLKPNWKYE